MSEQEKNPIKKIDQLLNDVGSLSKPKEQIQDKAPKEDKTSNSGSENSSKDKKPKLKKISDDMDTAFDKGDGAGKSKKLWYALGAVFITLAVLGGVYAFLSRPLSEAQKNELYANGTFVEGVSVFDVDVSGDTMARAREKLSGKVDFTGDQVLLELKLKDTVIPVKASDLQVENTVDSVLNEAMLYGREGSLIKKINDKNNAKKNGKNFDVSIYTDDKSLENLVSTIVQNYSVAAKDADVQLNQSGEEKFTFTPEQVGMQISADGLAQKIKTHIENQETGYIELDYTETQPKVTVGQLRQNMVLRSTYSTNVSGATGRRKNVALAATKINGKKVMPGEEFNIEQELGPRTAANGWSIGGEFVNGELVNGYGGGICQASSTLFNAVIRADLQVVKRSNHSQTVGYVPLGFDATISSGGPYFIWKNNTNYPIYIFASGGMNKLTIELYGAPLPYGDNITYEEKVSASGTITSGRKVESALVFYKDGKEVHRISWSSSYKGKPTKITTTKGTTTTTTKAETTTPSKAPASQNSNQQKPADQKPNQQKPADQKPADQKPNQQKPPANNSVKQED